MIALHASALIRWRIWVIVAWGVLAVLLLPRAAHVQRVLEVRGRSTRPTEASRANDVLRRAFPSPFAEYVAIVVQGPVPATDPRFGAVLDSLKSATGRLPYISQVVSLAALGESTLVAPNRRTTFLIGALTNRAAEDVSNNFVPDLRDSIRATLARMPTAAGYDVKVTGTPALDYDVRTISAEDTDQGERRALPLTLLVLVVAFGALVAAMLPIVVGVLAITIALGLVTVAARFQTMSVFVLNITTMVGLGVGIDYSLLIVTRFREELNRGLDAAAAAIRTIETAGSAVVTSGITVIVGFLALVLTTSLTDTRSVGMGGLIVVAVAVLLATTFLPAMLSYLGRNIDRPKWLARPLARFHAPTGWERWARWLGHRPWRAVFLGAAGVALLTAPLTQIKLGLPATHWFPPESESGEAWTELRSIGASGVITPIRMVVQLPAGGRLSAPEIAGLKVLTDSIAKYPRVKEVRGIANLQRGMSTLQLMIYYSDIAAARARNPRFLNAYLSSDNRTTLIDVIPADSVSLTGQMELARSVRALARRGVRGLTGARILVGGFAASSLDAQLELLRKLPLSFGFILGVTAIMLFFAFRSLLVPLKAVLLNCLSVSAAFGLTVLVFQHGYGGRLFGLEGPTQAIWGVAPVLVFATVFGLSMDYEVFLLTRVKEVFDKTGRNDYATMEGLSATASTITSAALIMILVFGTFAFTRVLAVQLIGFGLAAAVLLDATLIRMVLVPAIMHIAGRWNWWPGVRAPKDEAVPTTK
ncbi:MAG TPA: MMPL family transporter [Gemmatimonadales bacterium]|nr:MMPL family transporter [Gemmatimonadales bacterium]